MTGSANNFRCSPEHSPEVDNAEEAQSMCRSLRLWRPVQSKEKTISAAVLPYRRVSHQAPPRPLFSHYIFSDTSPTIPFAPQVLRIRASLRGGTLSLCRPAPRRRGAAPPARGHEPAACASRREGALRGEASFRSYYFVRCLFQMIFYGLPCSWR